MKRRPMILLHDYWRSSASYRVRIALNLKGLAFTSHPVNLLAAEHCDADNLARNPQGVVPTLEIDGLVLTQSLAIIDYIDRTRPDPPLLPADLAARARAMAQALMIVADIHPVGNLRVLNQLTECFGADDQARVAWNGHWIAQGFSALEQLAARDAAGGPFLAGAAPGLADVCLVPQMFNARRFGVALDAYPRLVAADAAASALPAFADAHPDRFQPA